MKVLPVVERELRVTARQKLTYGGRTASAAVAILLFFWIYGTSGGGGVASLSRNIFSFLAAAYFGLCLFAGIHQTADCISREKRMKTLGLLFLTDLRGYDIALGKLVATSINALYGIVAIFPILALPLLMGGVPLLSFGLLVAVLLTTLLFSLSLGLLASTICVQAKRAGGLAILMILTFTGGFPLLGMLLLHKEWLASEESIVPFLYFSPGSLCGFALSHLHGTRSPMGNIGAAMAVQWTIVLGALALTSFLLPRVLRNRTALQPVEKIRQWWRNQAYGQGSRRARRRTRLLEQNPVLWLNLRNRFSGNEARGVIAVGILLWLWGFHQWKQDWLDAPIPVVTAMLFNGLLKNACIVEPCRFFGEERKGGPLELLLCTPLSIRQILAGCESSFLRLYGYPILIALGVNLFLLITGVSREQSETYATYYILSFGIFIVVLIVDLYSILWLGMWAGLHHRTYLQAFNRVVLQILVLPWILVILVNMLMLNLLRVIPVDYTILFLGAYFVISLGISLLSLAQAKSRLRHDLTSLAVVNKA